MHVYNHWFGQVPNTVAPTVPVRYWNTAVPAAAAVWLFVYVLVSLIGNVFVPSGQSVYYEVVESMRAGVDLLTLGSVFPDAARSFQEVAARSVVEVTRYVSTWLLSCAAAVAVATVALKPRANTWALKGSVVREGDDAIRYARIVSKTTCKDSVSRTLHPDLMLPDEEWCRHILIFGKVGAGKTEILKHVIRQMLYRDEKLFCYDVKGDFTAYDDFCADELTPKGQQRRVVKRPIIVSPYDQRSYVWDIGCDCYTVAQVEVIVASFIPEESGGNNAFFTTAARMVFSAAIRTLIAKHGKGWGWVELRDQKNKTAEEMAGDIFEYYKAAYALVENAESQTTASIISTVKAYTQYIDILAQAWPSVGKRRYSVTEWASDDYTGRNAVIVQGGGIDGLTAAYISAMVNVAVQEIISPKLKDNKFLPPHKRRHINFVFDELTTAGRLNIFPLVALGRSKGVSFIAAVQSLKMLSKWYPPDEAETLPTIVGTHVVCQMQANKERKDVADLFSTNLMASKDHSPTSNVHTEGKAVMHEERLTRDIGPVSLKKGYGIKAIVRLANADPMILTWPGKPLPDKRDGQVPARWMLEAAAKSVDCGMEMVQKTPEDNQRKHVLGLSSEEIDQLFR